MRTVKIRATWIATLEKTIETDLTDGQIAMEIYKEEASIEFDTVKDLVEFNQLEIENIEEI